MYGVMVGSSILTRHWVEYRTGRVSKRINVCNFVRCFITVETYSITYDNNLVTYSTFHLAGE